jgi:hypothetical protein
MRNACGSERMLRSIIFAMLLVSVECLHPLATASGFALLKFRCLKGTKGGLPPLFIFADRRGQAALPNLEANSLA